MENEIIHYVESINQDPQWLRIIMNDITGLLVNLEYIDFFMQIYRQGIKYNVSNSSNQKVLIECLPHFEKLALSQFTVYIEVETMTHFLGAIIVKRVFLFNLIKLFYRC